MNKSELIKALAEETNIPFDDASLVVNTFIDAMKKSLIAGERIEIRGFGSFKIKEYGGYAGRNPKTGESVSVIPKRLPFFRAGKNLRNSSISSSRARGCVGRSRLRRRHPNRIRATAKPLFRGTVRVSNAA